jgi:hypothetical protein
MWKVKRGLLMEIEDDSREAEGKMGLILAQTKFV